MATKNLVSNPSQHLLRSQMLSDRRLPAQNLIISSSTKLKFNFQPFEIFNLSKFSTPFEMADALHGEFDEKTGCPKFFLKNGKKPQAVPLELPDGRKMEIVINSLDGEKINARQVKVIAQQAKQYNKARDIRARMLLKLEMKKASGGTFGETEARK